MKRNLPIILILILASFLRLVVLGKIPSGISPDEVSQGYSAYSLLKTGRDEWGIVWPVTSFRSFLDYKSPLQTYLMIPSIAIFGLNEFGVRLPSAIFGILAVLAIYLLTNELFPNKRLLNTKYLILDAGVVAAFFLSISPWAVQFSRTALEINISSFLFPIGLYFFLRGWRKSIFFYLAAFVWGVNLYSYHAAKFFEPIFFIYLAIAYRSQFSKLDLKVKIRVFVITSLIVAPLLFATVFGSAGERAKDLLIIKLNSQEIDSIAKLQFFSPLNRISLIPARLFSNKATFILKGFSDNYFSYLSPSFWFTEGGREITYSVLPGTGLLFLFMFPLIAYALYQLIKAKNPRLGLLIAWLLLGIIPAALTKGGYRPNRVGALLAFWEILAAYGLVEMVQMLHFSKRKYLSIILAIISFITVFSYFNTYFFEYQFKFPAALSYGYRDLVKKISSYPDNLPVIVDRGSNSQAFFAFYEHMDPNLFQKYSTTWWQEIVKDRPQYLDQLENYHLKNLSFKTFNSGADLIPGNLVIIPAEKMSDSYLPYLVERVIFPDGAVAFYLLQKNEK